MKCMNCGATLTESVYCPNCGFDVSVQRQAIILSGLYYNQGLEKAQVRDLSGSIDQLKRSLKFNKLNVPARNLLGLVYFETGEVVAALSEWVISKNIQPDNNVATEYIDELQRDANRLDTINQTIKKYNIALENCYKGNEDVAEIQLKKILAQNPKLIKGYHLLTLLHLKKHEFEKARKLLKKAIRIDKTNTTTLRFLKEVDEQTGTATALEPKISRWMGRERTEENVLSVEGPYRMDEEMKEAQTRPRRDTTLGMTLMNMVFGALIGAACIWFLFIPARTQRINKEANEKISNYSSQMAVRSAEYDELQEQLNTTKETLSRTEQQLEVTNGRVENEATLFEAYAKAQGDSQTEAWEMLSKIDPDTLESNSRALYNDLRLQLMDKLMASSMQSGRDAFIAGDYQAAIPFFEQAKAVNPIDYDVLNYLAHSYRKTGDTAKADAVFTEIINTYPGSAWATEAQGYIGAAADVDLPASISPYATQSSEAESYSEETDYEEDYEENYDGDEG